MTYQTNPDRPAPDLTCPLMAIHGTTPGPRLVVTGPRETVETLANRLWDVIGLIGIRGALILREDTQSPEFDFAYNVLKLNGEIEVSQSRTLDRMSALGMIGGHGFPPLWGA